MVMVKGPSGSGKGDCINVLKKALGRRVLGTGNEWIADGPPSEIDVTGHDILLYEPAILTVDEVGQRNQGCRPAPVDPHGKHGVGQAPPLRVSAPGDAAIPDVDNRRRHPPDAPWVGG